MVNRFRTGRIKGRFDERIISWGKLEKAGCHVIYGLVGLKTHSKITLVVRREENGIRRYASWNLITMILRVYRPGTLPARIRR